jgi:hypothetical protein
MAVGFGRIRVDSWTPEMESTSPVCQQPPCLGEAREVEARPRGAADQVHSPRVPVLDLVAVVGVDGHHSVSSMGQGLADIACHVIGCLQRGAFKVR